MAKTFFYNSYNLNSFAPMGGTGPGFPDPQIVPYKGEKVLAPWQIKKTDGKGMAYVEV